MEARIVYKLVRKLKDGNLYPLFINKNVPYVLGEWKKAEFHPTKGFADRMGFHCCMQPVAPHLSERLASGEERVWIECKATDCEKYDRPESQGGAWLLCQNLCPIRVIPWEEVREMQKAYKESKNA